MRLQMSLKDPSQTKGVIPATPTEASTIEKNIVALRTPGPWRSACWVHNASARKAIGRECYGP